MCTEKLPNRDAEQRQDDWPLTEHKDDAREEVLRQKEVEQEQENERERRRSQEESERRRRNIFG